MKKPGYIAEFKRLLKYMKGRYIRYWVGIVGVASMSSAFSVVVAFVFKNMLDAAQLGDIKLLWRSGIMTLVAVVGINLLTPIFYIMMSFSVDNAKVKTYLVLYEKLMRLPMAYYEKHHSGDIISRVSFDVGDATAAFSGYFLDGISTVLTGVANGVALFVLDVRFGIIAFVMGFFAMLLNRRFAPIFRILNNKKNAARHDWTIKLLDVLAGMSAIRLFGLQDKMRSEYCQASEASAQATINRGNAHSNLETGNAVMGQITFSLVIIIGIFLVQQGRATFGTVVAVTQLLSGVHELFTQAGGFFALTQRSLASAARLYEILDAQEEPKVNTPIHPLPSLSSYETAISVSNAYFSYENGNPILTDVSFDVPRGAMVAIVGPSGGGKSTVMKLILGYYPLTKGNISILGGSMSDTPLALLREKVAYVSQESYLFQGTIYDNIAFGNLSATEEDIIRAAKLANAYDFILEQPEGFNTQVGERGSHLSGGQRQRIAIARAFVKNAPILLLDEATASLDSQNEAAVQAAITRLMENRTTLVIAHRLSTIENADNIIVIDHGCVVEQGSHSELLAREGVYAHLYNMNFQQQVS